MSISQRRYLYLVVFMGGMTSLAIELSASRLLGTVFGTSNIIWANIIGLILLYLTAGYFLGGRLADRNPHPEPFYRVILWAAFTTGLIPVLARPVLRFAGWAVLNVNSAILVGSFGVVLILFSVPVTLLGMISPFAIRLAIEDAESAGQVSGRMYAISTIGSILGTFLPVLVLIPLIGTSFTFIAFAALLTIIALTGMWMVNRKQAIRFMWVPAAIIILAVIISQMGTTLRPIPSGTTLIYEDESAYNYIQVIRWNSANVLLLNEGQGIHSMYYPESPEYIETRGTWDYFLAAPFFNNPPYTPDDVNSLALVGLAGGTIAKQYTTVFGPILIDGFEIDPAIVQTGQDYFGMDEENLNVIVQDGRYALHISENTYDVIGVDAYRLPYIPWHLTTVEFFQDVHDHLSDQGVLAINVGRTVNDRRLIDAFAATMGEVFPSIHVIDVPGSCNSIMVATVQPTDPDNLLENMAQFDDSVYPLLRTVIGTAHQQIQTVPEGGPIFTDDHAPIEQLTDSILVNFVLSGSSALPCE